MSPSGVCVGMINYTERIALLMKDIVARTPRLSFIDLNQVIVFARFGRSDAEGAFATCHCLTLPESEPGYWGDKLVHKEHLEDFLQLFEAMKAIFDFEQISLCVHEKDREWFSDYAEHAGNGFFDVRYVPDTYALGEEKTLVKHATDARVPRFLDTPQGMRRPGIPPDVGKVVNNSETLLNVYNALFLGKPTTTTVFTLYGEGIDLKVYEVPIGASFAEVLEIAGLDV